MKKTLFLALLLSASIVLTQYDRVSAAFPYPSSSQLAPSPNNGYILSTDGTDSQWIVNTGGSGGGLATSSPWTTGYLAYVVNNATVSSVATGTLTTTAPGLELDATRSLIGGSAILSLTNGYIIPLVASTTAWNGFYDVPSTRITAGTGIDWTSNTLNVTLGDFSTSDLSEGSNLYYTDARVSSYIAASSSILTVATEAGLEAYLTDVSNVFTNNDGSLSDDDLSNNSTSDLSEGTNLYYTAARVIAELLNGNDAIFTNSTTTNQYISGRLNFGGVNGSAWSDFCTSITGGSGLCDGVDDTAGGGGIGTTSPWTIGNIVEVASNSSVKSTSSISSSKLSSDVVLETEIDTEAELEAILTDVTNLLTNNDTTDDLTQGASNLYNQTHTGDVTGATALAIAADVVDLANIDNTATLAGNPALAANDCFFGDNGIICEGTTADAFEGLLAFPVTASDKTWTFPDTTGTVALLNSAMTGTFDGNNFGGGAIGANQLLYGSAAGTFGEINAGTSAQLLQANGSGVPGFVSMSGEATIAVGGAVTLADSVAVSSWNLTTPTLTSFFGTPCTGNQFLQDIADTGAFTCATASGGGSGALSTTTDKIGPGAAATVSYVTDEFMLGGSSTTTAEFLFDYTHPFFQINATTTLASTTILSMDTTQAVIIGEGDTGADDQPLVGEAIEFDFGTAGDVIVSGLSAVADFALSGMDLVIDSTAQIIASVGGTRRIVAEPEQVLFSLTVGSTSPAMLGQKTIPIAKYVHKAREITQYRCWVQGGTSQVLDVTDNTNDTETITCATTLTSDTDVATNDTFTANELWGLEFGATTGAVNYVTIEVLGYINE